VGLAQPRALTRPQIREAERGLKELGYWTGPVDGVVDEATRSALIAFQKWEGRAVTGRFTRLELEAIVSSAAPKARELGYEHVEVDIDRQVLLLVNNEGGVRVLPVSTGSGKPFVSDGQTSVFTIRVTVGKTASWDRSSTLITSPAVSRFTVTKASRLDPPVTDAFASQCSPRVT
jgi:peptidoglycan hydrolase-like protein with peptidoglycan-binding domain